MDKWINGFHFKREIPINSIENGDFIKASKI